MKNIFPGLISEPHGQGTRWRVRQKGNHKKKVTISVGPEHADFLRQYKIARTGVNPKQNARKKLRAQGDLDASISAAFNGAKTRAKSKNVPFSISKSMLYDLLYEQDHCCAISRMEFNIEKFEAGARNPRNISLHRIIPYKGYVHGNIRLVTTIVNIGISDFGEQEFIDMCTAVAKQTCPQKILGDK
jgi:hypothetical protein